MATVCAVMLAENGHDVRLWSAFADAAEALARTRRSRFLPEARLPDGVEVTAEDSEALGERDLAVSAVPTQFVRRV